MAILNDYQTYIAKSRFARWKYEQKQREDWEDTVGRYITFFADKFQDKLGRDIFDELKESITNLHTMPSMRALMTAGKALERDNVAQYNPVVGETRIVTKECGNCKISNFSNGAVITVLNKNGEWALGEVHEYGKQLTTEVTFKLNSNTVKTVECSLNHRWLMEDGTVVPASKVKKGDKINFVSAAKADDSNLDYDLGIKHGIVFGDGTSIKSFGRVEGYKVRLCGRSRELLRFFDGYTVCYPPSCCGDPVVLLHGSFAATHSLKHLPFEETSSYILGFIRGWLAADGSVTTGGQVSLCTNEEGLNWLKSNAEVAGFVIQRVQQQSNTTNFGVRTKDSFVVYFSRSSMIDSDFLCSWKKERFKPLKSYFIVYDNVPTGVEKLVYCVEVPDTNTFVIEGGLVTGNCAYVPIDDPRAFDEAMYLSMCGVGVGFSVERQFVNQLPTIAESFYPVDTVIKVKDSRIGWASATRQLIGLLYGGSVPQWDTSGLRGKGAILKTFGGRASGPEPLERLFKFLIATFKKAAGRKLQSIECHDIMCVIAEIVTCGGVRRSALLSLSNLSDDRMRHAKSGNWGAEFPYRRLANNSVAYTELPEMGAFMREGVALYESKSGERGLFNRVAAQQQAKLSGRRKFDVEFGCNPCCEINLRPEEFCNLSTWIIRPNDTLDQMRDKVRLATILGTMQSAIVDFRYIRKEWRKNCEEERLLGVTPTGIADHTFMSAPSDELAVFLEELKMGAIDTNFAFAEKLGINPSAAVTCIKPAGETSELVGTSPGVHDYYGQFVERAVREDRKNPICQFLIDAGIPHEPDQNQPNDIMIFYFPLKAAGPNTKLRTQNDAISQLELYLIYRTHYCEHNVSCTVYVREHEWLDVWAWVRKHFDKCTGLSFLPYSDHTYLQAPFTEITEAEYLKKVEAFPVIDWSKLSEYEQEDYTTASKEVACSAGGCELI